MVAVTLSRTHTGHIISPNDHRHIIWQPSAFYLMQCLLHVDNFVNTRRGILTTAYIDIIIIFLNLLCQQMIKAKEFLAVLFPAVFLVRAVKTFWGWTKFFGGIHHNIVGKF